jgi:phage shock protein PspC (stress-responsive transcriptional regulator)
MYCIVLSLLLYLQKITTVSYTIPNAMKKTVSVSLGGFAFMLEEDAFFALESYIEQLKRRFVSDKDCLEIIGDIESRMAEHLHEKAPSTDRVLSVDDIKRVIGIMGQPSEFGDEKDSSEGFASTSNASYRRMYRDPDNRIIGGVAAGMGAYFKTDPLLFRIIFAITSFWGGIGAIVYIILWVVLPEAITAAEKLEMRGEPVTAENIGRSFKGSSK